MMIKKINNFRYFLVAAIMFCAFGNVSAGGASQSKNYLVQPGDVLHVAVWKEEDLTLDVLVRPDGHFSFPLAGDINGNGKNAQQITKELAKKIEKYIPDPVITVSVVQILGNKIFVIGKVNNPGEFIMSHDIDVVQAMSMAGGASTFAGLNKIKILRRDKTGKQSAIPFKYADIEEGRNLQQNILLEPGDVVVVP
ncbi:MAG: polysaccharide biosynthesis/export family protein [Gammaproteobacteria bacterium]